MQQALDVQMYDLSYVVVYAVAPGAETQGLHRDVWVDMLARKQFDAQ